MGAGAASECRTIEYEEVAPVDIPDTIAGDEESGFLRHRITAEHVIEAKFRVCDNHVAIRPEDVVETRKLFEQEPDFIPFGSRSLSR